MSVVVLLDVSARLEAPRAARDQGAVATVHGVAARLSAVEDDSGVAEVAIWIARAAFPATSVDPNAMRVVMSSVRCKRPHGSTW